LQTKGGKTNAERRSALAPPAFRRLPGPNVDLTASDSEVTGPGTADQRYS